MEQLMELLTSMLPPTLASRGGSGLSLSFLRPFLFGLRELAAERRTDGDYTDNKRRSAGRRVSCINYIFIFCV